MTIGALRALREHGLSVPDDIALCCFDDFAWADLFTPRLTAIAQPSREIGAQAVGVLLERLAAPDRPARTVRLPCAFVHRASCGCADEPERSQRPQASQRPQPLQPPGSLQPSQISQPSQLSQSERGTVS